MIGLAVIYKLFNSLIMKDLLKLHKHLLVFIVVGAIIFIALFFFTPTSSKEILDTLLNHIDFILIIICTYLLLNLFIKEYFVKHMTA
jgi:hypothetical protein